MAKDNKQKENVTRGGEAPARRLVAFQPYLTVFHNAMRNQRAPFTGTHLTCCPIVKYGAIRLPVSVWSVVLHIHGTRRPHLGQHLLTGLLMEELSAETACPFAIPDSFQRVRLPQLH
jgi:hypothetical protein